MMSSRKGHAAARVINAGVLRLFFLPNPGECSRRQQHIREEASKSELHRQDSDLQGLRSGIHLDFWGTGVLPVSWSRERAGPMPVLPRGTPRVRRRRWLRRQPWHEWPARVLHGDLQQLRERGASPVPATWRQARVLQLLLRAGSPQRFSSLRLTANCRRRKSRSERTGSFYLLTDTRFTGTRFARPARSCTSVCSGSRWLPSLHR